MNSETLKICKLCLSSENKFRPHRSKCIKCLSKISNEKIKTNPDYFKDYYLKNREHIRNTTKKNQEKYKLNSIA